MSANGNSKLPRRVLKRTLDGATFSLAAPTHGQTRAFARKLDERDKQTKEDRINSISQFVCDSLNDATPGLGLKPESVDDVMDAETFSFLYRELLSIAGFTVKEDSPNPTTAASSTSLPTQDAA